MEEPSPMAGEFPEQRKSAEGKGDGEITAGKNSQICANL